MSILLWALQTVDMILFSETSSGQSTSVVEINCCAYFHTQQNSKPGCRNKQQDSNLSLASTFGEGSDIISYLRYLGRSFLEGKIFSLWLCSSQKCLIAVVPALMELIITVTKLSFHRVLFIHTMGPLQKCYWQNNFISAKNWKEKKARYVLQS